MKHHLAVTLLGALLSTAPAALVSIQNASFENALGFWAHETSPSSWFGDYDAVASPGKLPDSTCQYSLPLGTFAADTIYTLSVLEPTSDAFADRSSVIAPGSGITLASAAASAVTHWSSLSEAEFTDVSLLVNTATRPALVRQDIGIFLGQTTTGSPFGRTAIFDNVRLDATSVLALPCVSPGGGACKNACGLIPQQS